MDLQIPEGVGQVPVGLLHIRDNVHRLLLQLRVRDVDVLAGDHDVAAVGVDRTIAEQRLREGRCKIRRELRVERRVAARRVEAGRVEDSVI